MADLDLTQFMPAEPSKAKKITHGTILPILSALEQIATSYKTKGQYVGNSVAKQLEGYQQRDAQQEAAKGEAIDRALRYKQLTKSQEDEAAKKSRQSEFETGMSGVAEMPEDQRMAAAQRLLAKFDPEKYGSQVAFPKPSMESEIAKAMAILNATEPIKQKFSLEADRIKREREAAELANKPLSGDAAKLSALTQSVPGDAAKLREMITKNGARWVAANYKAGNPSVTLLIDNLADAKGRIRSGGAVNTDEESRFKRPFTSFSQIAMNDQAAMLSALQSLEDETSNAAKGLGRPVSDVTIQPGSTQDNVSANYKPGDTRVNKKGQKIQMQPDRTWKIIQ